MNGTLFKSVLLAALAVVCVAAPLVIRHRARLELQAKADLFHERARHLAELTAAHQHLSNRVAQASASALSKDQLNELLRLRSEIGRLRDIAKEVGTLRAANQELMARPRQNGPLATASPPDPAVVQAYWPKDQLGSAGYQDPVSALKTALWAMSRGDGNALAASVTTNAWSRLTRDEWHDRGDPADEMAKAAGSIAQSLGAASGFYVSGQKKISENDIVLDVFFEGEGRTRKIAMKRTGGEWRFHLMGRAGADDQEVAGDFGAWP